MLTSSTTPATYAYNGNSSMARSLRDHTITTTKDDRCTYIPIGTTHPMLIDICWKLQEGKEEEGEEGEEGKEAGLTKEARSGMLVFLRNAVELVVARCLHEKHR